MKLRQLTRLAGVALCVLAFCGTASATGGGEKAKATPPGQAKKVEKAKASAEAQVKETSKTSADTTAAAAAQAKAAAKTATKPTSQASQQTVTSTSPPNQGNSSMVLTVNGSPCASPIAGAKVEGGLGTTINVSAGQPIARVTLKSGNGATVVSSSFGADFKTATITLSKDVSNYIVWTCGADVKAPTGGSDTKLEDVCPNIAGMQTTVPAGNVKDAQGNCVAPSVVAAAPTAPPAGEVKGAVSPTVTAEDSPTVKAGAKAEAKANGPAQAQPASGVLGATASAPEAIGETGESGTLPFTGIPIWFIALLGAGLLLTGLALRRSSQH